MTGEEIAVHPDNGCWVVTVMDWNPGFQAVFPATQEAEARRYAMANHYDCEFVKWGEPEDG